MIPRYFKTGNTFCFASNTYFLCAKNCVPVVSVVCPLIHAISRKQRFGFFWEKRRRGFIEVNLVEGEESRD